jgi:NADP-dependent 3-hydroxy acid dehydrogenase YdfG|eukprot:COSAG06_NODE_606_length_13867_cov_16.158701_12_plen_137_part_00
MSEDPSAKRPKTTDSGAMAAAATSMEGKVCVITGASSGIGEAIARALHAAGALVCVGARREEKLAALCAELEGAVYLPTDVAKRADVHALVAKAEEAFGKGVHLLVNVAGVMYFTCVALRPLHMLCCSACCRRRGG